MSTDKSKLSPPMDLRELVGYTGGGFISSSKPSKSSKNKALWFSGSESQTTQAQKGLAKLGKDPGEIDGKWGPSTQSAWIRLVESTSGSDPSTNLYLEGLLNKSPSVKDINEVFKLNGLK